MAKKSTRHRWVNRYTARIDGHLKEVDACATCGAERAGRTTTPANLWRVHRRLPWRTPPSPLPNCLEVRQRVAELSEGPRPNVRPVEPLPKLPTERGDALDEAITALAESFSGATIRGAPGELTRVCLAALGVIAASGRDVSAWQWALDAEGLTVSPVADDDQTGIKAPVARFQYS